MLVKKQWLKSTKIKSNGIPMYNAWEGWFLFGLIPLILIQKDTVSVNVK